MFLFDIVNLEDDARTSGKIWSLYRIEAEKVDDALVERWHKSMDGLLLFVSVVFCYSAIYNMVSVLLSFIRLEFFQLQ